MCLKGNTIITTTACIHVRKIRPITSLACRATLPFPRMSIVCTMCKAVNGNVYAKVPIVSFFFFSFSSSYGFFSGDDFHQARWRLALWRMNRDCMILPTIQMTLRPHTGGSLRVRRGERTSILLSPTFGDQG